jgi:23S rRNA (pseudouridine1915-N3)-methyltransferase
MKVRVIAVGTRLPAWVNEGFEDYARRLRGDMPLQLHQLATARRSGGGDAKRAMAEEARAMLALLGPRDHVVALDERGTQYSTKQLSAWLARRRASGQDLALLIGGPDGLAEPVLARAAERWSLSQLTLPHALVRVIVAEQLYRAATVLAGHPYHRT